MENLRLKIRKSKNGTYYIPSLSIKKLRMLDKKGKHNHEGRKKDPKNDLYEQALVKGPQNLLGE